MLFITLYLIYLITLDVHVVVVVKMYVFATYLNVLF